MRKILCDSQTPTNFSPKIIFNLLHLLLIFFNHDVISFLLSSFALAVSEKGHQRCQKRRTRVFLLKEFSNFYFIYLFCPIQSPLQSRSFYLILYTLTLV